METVSITGQLSFSDKALVSILQFPVSRVYIALIEATTTGMPKFKLGGEERASAEICRIDDIYDCVRMLISYISAGNAFFRGKRRHGVRSQTVNQLVRRLARVLLIRLSFCARPSYLRVRVSRKRVVHCRFSAVGIAERKQFSLCVLLFKN